MGKHLQTVADHVTDITISTATVDIQVMRIGTKQMTLAVFRQLPEKSIFKPWGYLVAPPWGWVNYDCGFRGKPFVFSFEGVLYRDSVDLEVPDGLIFKAETKERRNTYYDRELVPTGNWFIAYTEEGYAERNYFRLMFDSEQSARAYLANRLVSVATLKEAPQLFIGV